MADNLDVNPNPVNPDNLPGLARRLVFEHVTNRLEKTDIHVAFAETDVYVVWFAFTLGNWKALASTTLPNGQYFEVTCNKGKGEIYIDTYVKIDNVAISMV